MAGAGIWTTMVTGDAVPSASDGWRSLLVKLDPTVYEINPTNNHVEDLITTAVAPYISQYFKTKPQKKAVPLVWADLSVQCKAAYEANKTLPSAVVSVNGRPTTPKKSWSSWETFGEAYYNLVRNGDSLGVWVPDNVKIEEAALGQNVEGSLLLHNKYKAASQRGSKSGVFSILVDGAADYALGEDIDWEGMRGYGAESAKGFAEKYILWQNGQSIPDFEGAMKTLGILRLANQSALDTYKRLVAQAETTREKETLARFEPEEVWSWDAIDSVEDFLAVHAWRWRFCTDAVLEVDGTWVEPTEDPQSIKEWSDNFYSRFIEDEDEVLVGVVGYMPPKDIWEKCTKDVQSQS